jgi:hypothetical protein
MTITTTNKGSQGIQQSFNNNLSNGVAAYAVVGTIAFGAIRLTSNFVRLKWNSEKQVSSLLCENKLNKQAASPNPNASPQTPAAVSRHTLPMFAEPNSQSFTYSEPRTTAPSPIIDGTYPSPDDFQQQQQSHETKYLLPDTEKQQSPQSSPQKAPNLERNQAEIARLTADSPPRRTPLETWRETQKARKRDREAILLTNPLAAKFAKEAEQAKRKAQEAQEALTKASQANMNRRAIETDRARKEARLLNNPTAAKIASLIETEKAKRLAAKQTNLPSSL